MSQSRNRAPNKSTAMRQSPRQRKPAPGQQVSKNSAASREPHSRREALTRRDFSQSAFEYHASLLSDRRLSQHMYAQQRAMIVQQLQRDYGNRYVQRLVRHLSQQRAETVQTKLTVGPAGDKYEQEADQVAKEVMGTISSSGPEPAQRATPEEEEMVQGKFLARRAGPEEEEVLQGKLLAQRAGPEEEEMLQGKFLAQRQVPAEGGDVDLETESVINRAKGGGQDLPDNLRSSMEGAFGADFSGVKVHTDAQADALNADMSARAFTTGQDIFLSKGEYNPGSASGQELLAHELTHVVQQGAAPARATQTGPLPEDESGDTQRLGRMVDSKVQRDPDPPGGLPPPPKEPDPEQGSGQEAEIERGPTLQQAQVAENQLVHIISNVKSSAQGLAKNAGTNYLKGKSEIVKQATVNLESTQLEMSSLVSKLQTAKSAQLEALNQDFLLLTEQANEQIMTLRTGFYDAGDALVSPGMAPNMSPELQKKTGEDFNAIGNVLSMHLRLGTRELAGAEEETGAGDLVSETEKKVVQVADATAVIEQVVTAAQIFQGTTAAGQAFSAGTGVGMAAEAIGGAIEAVEAGHKIISGGLDAAENAEAAMNFAGGVAQMTKGVTGTALFAVNTIKLVQGVGSEAAMQAAGAAGIAQAFAPATIALGAVDMLQGSYGVYKASKREKALKDIELSASLLNTQEAKDVSEAAKVAAQTQNTKKWEAGTTAVKGAVAVVAGTALMAAGLTNPVGWIVLAAAGLIAFGAFIGKKVWQHAQGKKLQQREQKKYEAKLKDWKELHPTAEEQKVNIATRPELPPRFAKENIGLFGKGKMTYAKLFREEMERERSVVALKLANNLKKDPAEQNQHMLQIVQQMGFNLKKKTPDAKAIMKRLRGK